MEPAIRSRRCIPGIAEGRAGGGARRRRRGSGGRRGAHVGAVRAIIDYTRGAARRRRLMLPRRAGSDAAGWPPPAGSWDLLVNGTPLGESLRTRQLAAARRTVRRDARVRPDLRGDRDTAPARGARGRLPGCSMACRCSSRRRSGSLEWWTADVPVPA